MPVPVITIDGPAASGKGTIAARTARALNFHLLDSGKLYRAAALAAQQAHIAADDFPAMATLLRTLAQTPADLQSLAADPRATDPETGDRASRLAADPTLRGLLVPLQRAARRPPGLVADGRDMGTVIFPDAACKFYLTADLARRAERRQAQLAERGKHATIESVRAELQQRDHRDHHRTVAPLQEPSDAIRLDSTDQSIDDIAQTVIRAYRHAVFIPSPTEHTL